MIPELLAPAGSAPAFEAALNAGADAVYLGVPAFNARALARDFRLVEIPALIDFAHSRGKRVYPAMNSLVKEEELGQALTTLAFLAKSEADGVILQDWGLLRLARRHVPDLPLHASTLMTAHNSVMVRHLAGLGCRRVVLARELSLVEMRRIESQTRALGVDLEVFVHGAMCFCYSGLCRFSSLHGGKSSLRGQCVQPCRRRYQWLDAGAAGQSGKPGKGGGKSGKSGKRKDRPTRPEDGYLFSMNDLSGLEHLAELAKTGVRSLKIEGRLKPVTYVHNVVRAYRLGLDALNEGDEPTRAAMMEEARAHLAAALGRRTASGFFLPGAPESGALITPGLSGNTGQAVAVVREVDVRKRQGRTVTVRIAMLVKETVRHGDRLRLHEEKSDTRVSLTLRDFRVAGEPRKEARPGETLIVQSADAALCALRLPWRATLYRVDVSERRQERVSEELARMLEAQPTSVLFAEEPKNMRPARPAKTGKAQWWVQTASLGALQQRFPFAVSRWLLTLNARNVDQALSGGLRRRGRDLRVTWVLPPVILEDRLPWIRDNLTRLREAGHRSFQLGHPGQLNLFTLPRGWSRREAARADLELFAGPAANALNHQTVLALAEMGFAGAQFSLETDRAGLKAALSALAAEPKQGRPACKLGLLVYGRPALFTARAQSPHFAGHHALRSPRDERFVLKVQDKNLASGVTVHAKEPFSLLEHGRELAASGLDYLVVDIGAGWLEQEVETLTALWNAASGRGPTPAHLAGNYDGRLA